VSPRSVFLADFGASRVKGALFHCGENRIVARAEEPSPEPHWGKAGEVEVDPGAYVPILERLVARTGESGLSPDAIWLCSEMHGFILDDGSGAPLVPYISWRDTRTAHVQPGAQTSIYEALKGEIGDQYLRITGMHLRPGSPLLGLLHIARREVKLAPARFLSLPEWIAVSGGEYSGKAHITITAGSGLLDVERNAWSERLTSLLGSSANRIRFGESSLADDVSLGHVRIGARALPLFGGFGDMQTAMHGAGIPRSSALAVNVGTGSQVARVAKAPVAGVEYRPFFGRSGLAAITYIPSGRALNLFARMLDDIAVPADAEQGQLWRRFAALSANDILSAPLRVDLNVFPGSWRYRDGGSIAGLTEETSGIESLVASIARGWLRQYADAIDVLDPKQNEHQFLLAGGLVRRCPAMVSVLEDMSGRRVLKSGADKDETLSGLVMLARGRA
jgi:sugar (pentulose or hexulose) kinase